MKRALNARLRTLDIIFKAERATDGWKHGRDWDNMEDTWEGQGREADGLC